MDEPNSLIVLIQRSCSTMAPSQPNAHGIAVGSHVVSASSQHQTTPEHAARSLQRRREPRLSTLLLLLSRMFLATMTSVSAAVWKHS